MLCWSWSLETGGPSQQAPAPAAKGSQMRLGPLAQSAARGPWGRQTNRLYRAAHLQRVQAQVFPGHATEVTGVMDKPSVPVIPVATHLPVCPAAFHTASDLCLSCYCKLGWLAS